MPLKISPSSTFSLLHYGNNISLKHGTYFCLSPCSQIFFIQLGVLLLLLFLILFSLGVLITNMARNGERNSIILKSLISIINVLLSCKHHNASCRTHTHSHSLHIH